MIKFAVSRPAQRKESIQRGLALLKWDEDPFLKNYGLKIDNNMLKTEARILNPPAVLFGKKAVVNPMYSGRWDLRGKQFLIGNHAPLKSWGVSVIKGPRQYVLSGGEGNLFVIKARLTCRTGLLGKLFQRSYVTLSRFIVVTAVRFII